MAKKTNQVSLKGLLDLDAMEVTEIIKDNENTYDFLAILKEYHDKQVTITIKEDDELPVKE